VILIQGHLVIWSYFKLQLFIRISKEIIHSTGASRNNIRSSSSSTNSYGSASITCIKISARSAAAATAVYE